MLRNSLLLIAIMLVLTSCAIGNSSTTFDASALLEEITKLPSNTSYSLLKNELRNAIETNKISEVTKEGNTWKFRDSGTSVGRLDHTLDIKSGFGNYKVTLDGSVVKPAEYLSVFSADEMEGIDKFDEYVMQRTKSSTAGIITYQPPYSSMKEVNELLISRVEYQNSFNLNKSEMERIITTLLSSEYTVNRFAALGESDYYLAISSLSKSVVLYYSSSRLLIGGFIFNDGEGLLL